ncbi:MAG TPA: ubiquinol-cytochrome c reductase iron-sulfur subunit [Gammaproteobacteria bacterium]|jgi:ubiquinol-cytochrome c reductase iron-sulfur subunit|nr:ubiquinol-cytochrome c reductase iron-sulfur subunit [Gammaproteobacteria bacterium]
MSNDSGLSRRHFLIGATTVTAAAGAVATAVPFVVSFNPSARARALGAAVTVDISNIESGAYIRVLWRGRAIYIVHRSPEMLERLETGNNDLRDPDSAESEQPQFAQNEFRSLRPELLVVEGVCTHLGCVPLSRFEVAPADLGPDWVGGFFCPCHGSMFDLSGRVFAGVPAPTNLTVPPYTFIDNDTVMIGSESGNV